MAKHDEHGGKDTASEPDCLPRPRAGSATASLNIPANQPIPIGFKLHHAYVVFDAGTGQFHMASGAVPLTFAK